MQATVKMARAGQIVIPKEIRDAMGLQSGDLITIDVMCKVEIPIVPKRNERGVILTPP